MPWISGKLRNAPSYPKQIDFWEAVNDCPLLYITYTDSKGNYGLYMGEDVKYHAVVDGKYAPPMLDIGASPQTVLLTYGSTPFVPAGACAEKAAQVEGAAAPAPNPTAGKRLVEYVYEESKAGAMKLKKALDDFDGRLVVDNNCLDSLNKRDLKELFGMKDIRGQLVPSWRLCQLFLWVPEADSAPEIEGFVECKDA